uniref:ARAD1B20372p n=1 Tax=Blastobotrys adeninivorans TaxID=409370 RepID=A0A060TD11_BLAAD
MTGTTNQENINGHTVGTDLPQAPTDLSFSCVEGFFVQGNKEIDDQEFNYLTANFGLAKDSWESFQEEFNKLVASEDENTRYKVLFLARHGQGYHNYMIETHGQEAWDTKYNEMEHNDEYTWAPDPELTPLGVQQARDNNSEWKNQVKKGIPMPTRWYVSPMTRSINTMLTTWDGIVDLTTEKRPLVVEDLREDLDYNTCNRRRPKSYIHKRFPMLRFEPSFPENDQLWAADYDEGESGHDVRTSRFLARLFAKDWDSPQDADRYVSTTSHAGTIYSFQRVIGHRPFKMGTGGMIPVIVKATKPSA